jgi:hypothetical protein
MGQSDRGGGAGDARHRVVLGHPEAVEAEALGMAREIAGIVEGDAGGGALRDRGEVED